MADDALRRANDQDLLITWNYFTNVMEVNLKTKSHELINANCKTQRHGPLLLKIMMDNLWADES